MEGEIAALFYRYKSVGGTEFVSDFLISGRCGAALRTHHGDSGTLWLYEEPPRLPQSPVVPAKGDSVSHASRSARAADGSRSRKSAPPEAATPANAPVLRPIALHWGQQDFFAGQGESGRKQFSIALGTCLSNVCRELDVDLVRGWNVDDPYTWGKVGHYTVAAIAIEAIKNKDLRDLMRANLPNITFANNKINGGLDTKNNPDLPKDPSKGRITPLADVPDIIWKQSKNTTDYGRMGDENPNHYADADAPSTDGKTLFELCDTKEKLTVENWLEYYQNIQKAAIGLDPKKDVSQGLICFRVWQIYDYMIAAFKASKDQRAAKFIFAAGVLAHYVGDGCQPLHSSYMSDGDPADTTTIDYVAKRTSKNHEIGEHYPKDTNPGQGVHTAYEDHMIDDKIDQIFPEVPNSSVNNDPIDPIADGQGAGFNVLTLMKLTQKTIHPKDIVEAFKAAKASGRNVSDALFEQFGQGTINCLARGARYLAAIWDAAWENGDGSTKITSKGQVAEQSLINLYSDRNELPSMHLDTIDGLLVK